MGPARTDRLLTIDRWQDEQDWRSFLRAFWAGLRGPRRPARGRWPGQVKGRGAPQGFRETARAAAAGRLRSFTWSSHLRRLLWAWVQLAWWASSRGCGAARGQTRPAPGPRVFPRWCGPSSRRQHRSPRSSTRRDPPALVLDVREGVVGHPAARENGWESWMSSPASTTAGAHGRGAGARLCYGWVHSLRWSWPGGSRCSPASTQWAAEPLRPRWKAREPLDRQSHCRIGGERGQKHHWPERLAKIPGEHIGAGDRWQSSTRCARSR